MDFTCYMTYIYCTEPRVSSDGFVYDVAKVLIPSNRGYNSVLSNKTLIFDKDYIEFDNFIKWLSMSM